MSSFTPLGDLVRASAGQRGFGGQIEAARVFRAFVSAAEAVSPELAADARPVSFTDGILRLRAANSAAAELLRFGREPLREEINRLLGGEIVREIR